MPAVQLTRLKAQVSELAWWFTRPNEFQRGLADLLSRYADWVYRPGQDMTAAQLVQAYRVPPLVMHQLEQELMRFIRENPGGAVSLANTLWQDSYLEPRQLAAFILGQLPPSFNTVVLEKLTNWCQPQEEQHALAALLEKGGSGLRRRAPQDWFRLLGTWLDTTKPPMQKMALQALRATIQDSESDNLPLVFQLLSLLMQNAQQEDSALSSAVLGELESVLVEIARRSPVETTHFLRQIVSTTSNPNFFRLTRRVLPQLPLRFQESLHQVLQLNSQSKSGTPSLPSDPLV